MEKGKNDTQDVLVYDSQTMVMKTKSDVNNDDRYGYLEVGISQILTAVPCYEVRYVSLATQHSYHSYRVETKN